MVQFRTICIGYCQPSGNSLKVEVASAAAAAALDAAFTTANHRGSEALELKLLMCFFFFFVGGGGVFHLASSPGCSISLLHLLHLEGYFPNPK